MVRKLRNFRWTPHLVRLLCCALLATQLLSGAQMVESGLERAQYYAGTCLAVDTNCTASGGQINLGEAPSHLLNLGVHLTGIVPQQIALQPARDKAAPVAREHALPQWLFATRIEHPPKA